MTESLLPAARSIATKLFGWTECDGRWEDTDFLVATKESDYSFQGYWRPEREFHIVTGWILGVGWNWGVLHSGRFGVWIQTETDRYENRLDSGESWELDCGLELLVEILWEIADEQE